MQQSILIGPVEVSVSNRLQLKQTLEVQAQFSTKDKIKGVAIMPINSITKTSIRLNSLI